MPGNFDTHILRTFVAVAQCGSLAQAAKLTGRSQPSVTQHIMRIEDIVGRQLLNRGPRGASLTKDGEAFLSYAQRILALTDEAIERFQTKRFKGKVTVGMIEDFAFELLSNALIDFMKLHADVELEVIVCGSDNLQGKLASGEVDIALGDPFYLKDFEIWQTKLTQKWYVSGELDLTQSPLPLIMFSEPCRWREPTLRSLDKAGIRWRIIYESSSLQAVHAATRSGLGMACCLEKARPPGTIEVPQSLRIPSAPRVEVCLATKLSKSKDPAVQYLAVLIQQLLTSGV